MLSQDISGEEEKNETQRRITQLIDDKIGEQTDEELNGDESFDNIIIESKKYYQKVFVPNKKRPFDVYMKDDLLSVLRNAFCFHRLRCAAKLMTSLSLDMRTPHFVVLRAALILYTQNSSDLHKDHLVQSMKKISKYDINRREIMLEIILHFLKNNDRNSAKTYVKNNESVIKSAVFRNEPIIDTYLKCYVAYLDYLEWKQLNNENQYNYYKFTSPSQIIGDKTILSLRNSIDESIGCQLDIFVLILLEMYEYYKQYIDAYDLLESYISKNENHLNSYIYLYNFCIKYPENTTSDQKFDALENICRLSPENILVLDYFESNKLSVEKNFDLIMEFIDYKINNNNIRAWILLKDFLGNIKDKKTNEMIINKWKQRYQSYWIRSHFNVSKINFSGNDSIDLINCKQTIISYLESSKHEFILKSKQLIN